MEDGPDETDRFLQLISKDLHKLKIDGVANSIKSKGFYELVSENYTELYQLKLGKENENDRFEYTIKLKDDKVAKLVECQGG